jgi:hypothetical protein
MSLANDTARCTGTRCPSAMNCRRYTERGTGSDTAWYAAFWARREAGSSACESIMPVRVVTTFVESEGGAE